MASEARKLLGVMSKLEASDLHLKEANRPLYRVHGELREAQHPPLSKEQMEEVARELIPQHLWNDWENSHSVDFATSIDVATRFRVNAFRTRGLISFAFRLLELEAKTFEMLRLPDVCYNLAQARRGLILVTGPTGSGKTTTLAAFINHINENRKEHIITIEDPIEYVYFDKLSRIDQREVGNDCTTFDQALRHALRQDPDVILVGEMRDKETILLAIRAAQTGHLVLSTLHTTTAIQTIARILKYFPAEEQESVRADLAVAANAVMCQRLLTNITGDGRIAAVEVMVGNDLIKRLIREDRLDDMATVMRGGTDGMQTFDAALAELVQSELITMEQGINYADDIQAFKRLASGQVSGADKAGLIGAF